MAVPDSQTIMRPMLVLLADGAEQPVASLRGRLVEHFGLTPEELAEELPSGRAKKVFQNEGLCVLTRTGGAYAYPATTSS